MVEQLIMTPLILVVSIAISVYIDNERKKLKPLAYWSLTVMALSLTVTVLPWLMAQNVTFSLLASIAAVIALFESLVMLTEKLEGGLKK